MTTPGKEKGMMAWGSDTIVDLVNPKFRGFSRPFCLASTIGLATLVTCVIFIINSLDKNDNCTLQSLPLYVQSSHALTHIKDSYEGFDCILGSSHSVSGKNFLCHRMDDITEDASAGMDQYFDYCPPSVQEQFFPEEIFTLHWERSQPEVACKEQVVKYGGTWIDGQGPDETKGGRWFEHCTAVLNACQGQTGDVSMIWYRKCPDEFLTVGAVLGYAAWVELVFTVVIILPLLAIGFIKNGKDGSGLKSIQGWLQELKEEATNQVEEVALSSALQ